MRPMSPGMACLAGLLAANLIGCATVDPAATVAATADELASRGVAGAQWRGDAADATALAVSRRLLAAPLTSARAGEVALLRSQALQATLAELGIAQADLAQATRLANPGLSFESLSGSGETLRTGGLAADVVDWLTQPLRRKVAEADLERTKLLVAAAVFDQVAEARRALVRVQAERAIVAQLAQAEEAERAAADYARALHDAGNLTLRESLLTQALWVEHRAELGQAKAGEARAAEALRRALGLGADESWDTALLSEPPPLPDPARLGLEESALDQRLDFAAALWSVQTLERARELRRRTRWLPVGVEVGLVHEKETDGIRLRGASISLALPIFDTGRASMARYDAEISRARSQRAALEQQIRSEVREAAGAFSAARDRAALFRDSLVPLRRQVLELTVLESNQMLVGAFDVLAAKQDLVDAETRYVEAVAQAWDARFDLERALGQIFDAEEEDTVEEYTAETQP